MAQSEDERALVGLEDDLSFASFAHGPPTPASEIRKTAQMAKSARRRCAVTNARSPSPSALHVTIRSLRLSHATSGGDFRVAARPQAPGRVGTGQRGHAGRRCATALRKALYRRSASAITATRQRMCVAGLTGDRVLRTAMDPFEQRRAHPRTVAALPCRPRWSPSNAGPTSSRTCLTLRVSPPPASVIALRRRVCVLTDIEEPWDLPGDHQGSLQLCSGATRESQIN
jgi:hypothetical protein